MTDPLGTHLDVRPDMSTDPWNDADGAQLARIVRIGLQPHATEKRRPVVALLCVTNGGTQFVAWTTWRLLNAAVRALGGGPIATADAERP